MLNRPSFVLISLIGAFLYGCYSPVNVKPVTFGHPDEIIRNDTFVALADRRVFAVMAFINACGFDEEANGTAKHYSQRKAYVSECLIRALDHRIRLIMENDPEAVKQRENTTKQLNRENVVKWIADEGLLLTEPFYRLLVEFEQSDISFEEYLPEMLKKLPEYQDRSTPAKGIDRNR